MRIATAFLIGQAAVAAASVFDTILPTEKPTITSDPWRCATRILESYFDVPKPTGSLLTAILSYGDKLQDGCESTLTDAIGMKVCTFPPQDDWCSFSDAVPSSLTAEYASYGGVASSWWAEHSSAAVSEARYCPNKWFKAMNALPYGAIWLNDTIAFAGCYAAADTTATSSGLNKLASATNGLGATSTGPMATATKTDETSGIAGRAEEVDMWVVAGTGLAAAAAVW